MAGGQQLIDDHYKLMSERKYIISGTHGQFQHYVRTNEGTNRHWVVGPDMLRGLKGVHGVFIGTWWNREDIEKIINVLYLSDSIDKDKRNMLIHERNRMIKKGL